MAAQRVRARGLLHGRAEGRLDLPALGPESVHFEAGAGLEQREGAVAVVAERLAEVRRAEARGPRRDHRLRHEALLLRLLPEEDRVVVRSEERRVGKEG